jgi:hypothetical protein
VIFTATTRQMGPAQDWAPPVYCDDDAREQTEALGTRFSTLRSEEAVQQNMGPFLIALTPATLLRERLGAALQSYKPTGVNSPRSAYDVTDNKRTTSHRA